MRERYLDKGRVLEGGRGGEGWKLMSGAARSSLALRFATARWKDSVSLIEVSGSVC